MRSTAARWIPAGLTTEQAVVLVAYSLIAVQLAFRAWAIYGGWFYTDDFRLLYESRENSPGLEYLFGPYDSQLMPGGRLIAWLVERSGSLNWTLAASISLSLQAAASLCCLGMLRSMFGVQWAILAPLAFYLFNAMTVPAFMWWAASLNQLPTQVTFFVAVWVWVKYLRTPRWYLGLLAGLALGLGLFFYVKVLFVVPVLVFMTAAYFCSGNAMQRIRQGAGRYWSGLGAVSLIAVAYVTYYVTYVPQLIAEPGNTHVGRLLETFVGTAFVTTAMGGPWGWQQPNPPTSQVDPPFVLVHLSWVAAAFVLVASVLLRRRVLRAWLLVGGYLALTFALLATTRGRIVGPFVGLELRYMTDVAAVMTIALGLVFLPLIGAHEPSEARDDPLLRLPHLPQIGVALTVVVCLGGVLSTFGHVRTWHVDHPGRDYVEEAISTLNQQPGVVSLADQEAPANVMVEWSYPHNLVSRLLALTDSKVRFPDATDRLFTLDKRGRLMKVSVEPGVMSVAGEDPDCGWLVGAFGREIPLEGHVLGLEYWMQVGYLSSSDGDVLLTLGDAELRAPVKRGLNNLYVRTHGDFDSVRIDGLEGDNALCISQIQVGFAEPGFEP